MAFSKSTKKKRTKKHKSTQKRLSFWKNRHLWLPAVLLLGITFLVFSPSLQCDFVNWDDDVNILENANVLNFDLRGIFTETVIGGYNPLTTLGFAIQHKLFGLNPTAFHFTNILFHLIATFFAYRLLLVLGLSRNAALLGAALFGMHPMRVESVTWITELKDVLFGSLYLAALFLYAKAIKNKKKVPHWWILPLFILSLFAKIQAVSLPLSMLAVDYYFGRPLKWGLVLEKIPYFALSLAVGLLGIYMLSSAETLNDDQYFGFLDRILIGIYSVCVYLVKLIVPYQMSPMYPYPYPLPWQVYVSPLLLGGLLFWVYRAFRKDQRAVVFAVLFFVFNIMFLLQVVGAGQGYLADRFTYIPYLGFFFLLGYGFDFFIKKQKAAAPVSYLSIGFVALMSFLTTQQIGVWKNSETLWLHVLKYYDTTYRPWGNLAHHYRENGRYDDAIHYYTEGIEHARRPSATVYNGRGKSYFDKAVRANPQQPDPALVNRAIADYTSGLQIDPSMSELRINRGAAHASIGQFEQALQDLKEGLAQDPNNANGYHNRSLIYSLTQQHEKAIADHDRYLALKPNSPDIYYERALAKMNLNRYDEAIADYTAAIRLNPNQAVYYQGRARAYAAKGDQNSANADSQKAKQLGGR